VREVATELIGAAAEFRELLLQFLVESFQSVGRLRKLNYEEEER
jgi:hypothetical protein